MVASSDCSSLFLPLAVLWFLAISTGTDATGTTLIWNAPTEICHSCSGSEGKNTSSFNPSRYNIVSNTNMSFFGTEMNLFYKMGEFPLLDASTTTLPCWVPHDHGNCSWDPWTNFTVKANGGVPQRANLSWHLDQVTKDVTKMIPNANYSHLLIIDWEAWRVPFSMNYDWLSKYIAYSEYLVAEEHPEWKKNPKQLRAEAEKQFNTAAQTFWVSTVRTIKQLRPNAKVGFYIYPLSMTQVDSLQWLWQEIDVLCPSIYVQTSESADTSFKKSVAGMETATAVVNATLKATNNTKQLIIAPYALSGVYLTVPPDPFTKASGAVGASYLVPIALGADYVILWGSSSSTQNCANCATLQNSWEQPFFGQVVKTCVEAGQRCARTHCGRKGVCVRTTYTAAEALQGKCPFSENTTVAADVKCRCFSKVGMFDRC